MSWGLKPAASVADLAAIELRRITDVLQVDHASLFLPDPDDPHRMVEVAEAGLPVSAALPEHRTILGRALRTARAQAIHCPDGPGEASCAVLATPLVHGDCAVGALLVVTLRANRRLGAIDAQVVGRAAQTLVERILAPTARLASPVASERFARDASASHR